MLPSLMKPWYLQGAAAAAEQELSQRDQLLADTQLQSFVCASLPISIVIYQDSAQLAMTSVAQAKGVLTAEKQSELFAQQKTGLCRQDANSLLASKLARLEKDWRYDLGSCTMVCSVLLHCTA